MIKKWWFANSAIVLPEEGGVYAVSWGGGHRQSELLFRAFLKYDDTVDLPEPEEKLPGAYIGKGKRNGYHPAPNLKRDSLHAGTLSETDDSLVNLQDGSVRNLYVKSGR